MPVSKNFQEDHGEDNDSSSRKVEVSPWSWREKKVGEEANIKGAEWILLSLLYWCSFLIVGRVTFKAVLCHKKWVFF